MIGAFQGLELGKRALLSHQYDLTTIGHNISNANTPGYTRQRLNLTATDPYSNTIGSFGTGVKVSSVQQIRDIFLTNQYRQGNAQLGRWSQRQRAMTEVENIFMEPSDSGFNTVLSEFFDTWHTLSQNPESSAGRAAVREQASLVADAFHQMARSLDDLQKSLDDEIAGHVTDINRIAKSLAELNLQIGREELGGATANDLRDKRDQLIDELSRNVDANVLVEKNGIVRVFIGTMELVEKGSFSPLTTKLTYSGTQKRTTVVWQGTSNTMNFASGELAGLVESRDELISEYRDMLNELASNFVTAVNALHRDGYALDGTNGHDFFDPNGLTADKIALSSDIKDDPKNIAASQSGGPGDNANAIAIANLQNALTMSGGTATFNDFYAGLTGVIGVRSAQATDAADNADLLLQQVEMSRQSVQGVSLDEEMANLIAAQHAYDAAARVITTMDSALDTIINDMGVSY